MIVEFFMNAADLAINRKWLSGRTKVLSSAYRDLKKHMAADIKKERAGMDQLTGEVEVHVRFGGSQCDIDAPIKATLDILQKARVFTNDKQVVRLVIEITDRNKEPWYSVEAMPFLRED